jgi:signal transduction histidine kinase
MTTQQLPDDKMRNRIKNLFAGQEPVSGASMPEVDALQSRIQELEAELARQPKADEQRMLFDTVRKPDAVLAEGGATPAQEPAIKKSWSPRLLSAPVFEGDTEKSRSARLLHQIVMASWILPLIALIVSFLNPSVGRFTVPAAVVLTITLAFIMFLNRAGMVRLGSYLLVGIMLIILTYLNYAGAGQPRPLLILTVIVIMMSGLLLGGRSPIVTAILVAAQHIVIVALAARGLIVAQSAAAAPLQNALVTTVSYLLIGFMLRLAIQRIQFVVNQLREDETELAIRNRELQEFSRSLEHRVADRTHDLELASSVGRAISEKVGNLTELLAGAAETVRSSFGLYYTQVYLLDAAGRTLVLRAGTGEIGTQLMRSGHRLALLSASLNARAASSQQPVLVDDTQKSTDFLPNRLLPLTRSELAVPLIANNRVVGVLDMQSDKPQTFNPANLPAFQVLAAQLAIAIQNATLFIQAEATRREVEEQARRLTRSGWQEFLNAIESSENIGYVFSQDEVLPLVGTQSSAYENKLSVPIQIAGANVGEVQFGDEASREWTAEEIELVQAAMTRVGQHLENLRLLAQADRYRAEAEQVSRRLTREGWSEYLRTREELADGYLYNQNEVLPLNGNGNDETMTAFSYPLIVRDETIGNMMVAIEDNRPQTNQVVTAVIEQLSDHIENLRLLEQTEQQRAEADKLYEIGQKISVAKDQQEIVAAVAENLGIPQINRAVLLSYEYSESGEMETVAVTANWYSGQGVPPTPLGRRYSTKVFTIANSFYGTDPGFVGNTQTDKRVDPATREVFQAQKIHAFISLPVWDDVRQVGSLLLQSEEVLSFTGEELLPYLSIMQQLGNALENQGLFEQTQKRANQLEAVATLSSTASTVLDPDKLLQAVVDLTKERFGLYHTHIYLADESWSTLLLAAGAGEIGRTLVAEEHFIAMDSEISLVARAARGQQTVIANDVKSNPDFLPNPWLPETRAEMAVPMIVGDKVLGVFDVQSDKVSGFSKEDAAIYTTLASQVAVALQNARLYVEQAATVTQLRELDRLKSSFLANMSHELRTPLNSILGFTDVILEGLDGELTDYMDNDLRLIQKNGQHLLHLINDVLDMAKIESGRMNLHPEKFKVHNILDEVTSITSTLASEKNVSLFIDENSDQEIEIYADNTRLRQVMINLVNNSIKFTETGNIILSATPMDGARVSITVKDTGIGIPPDKLDAVFQEFTQVDTSTTRKVGGTGLGLPISRRLVEMHGGRLWAESSGIEGEGSVFHVEMPVEARITEVIEKQEK